MVKEGERTTRKYGSFGRICTITHHDRHLNVRSKIRVTPPVRHKGI